jgi:hypothetical protein
MFPEESFAEVEWERIEEGWRKGQGYLAGKIVRNEGVVH